MNFFWCCEVDNQTISDRTSQLYFSNNAYSPYKILEDMQDPKLENLQLTLYGEENYSLVRNTQLNVISQDNSSPNSLPIEVLQMIVQKSKNIGERLQVFIPQSNDVQLLKYFIQQPKFKIYTLEDNQEYLNILKQQKIFKQLQYISQDFDNSFDLIIFNCSSSQERISSFFQNYQMNSFKNKVFILDYCKNIKNIISQIMKDQETQKEELMTISINGYFRYYIFFIGKISSTQNFSRLKSIEAILLQDYESQTNYQTLIKQMLKYLKQQNIPYSEILKIIGKIQSENHDELKKQQSDTMLQRFLSKIIANKNIDKSQIFEIFQSVFRAGQFTITPSQEQFSNNQINSYKCAILQNNSRMNDDK
ncbi:unnamed protein product [Paramecium primaurelia]|uniref:Uncharacterized protein n=1 Tax=Paramecium primaurelia TaxID=5886 RepID=A0A8S1JT69_PARPR|nr:unnamed protein product [Paramecium primaurelia]